MPTCHSSERRMICRGMSFLGINGFSPAAFRKSKFILFGGGSAAPAGRMHFFSQLWSEKATFRQMIVTNRRRYFSGVCANGWEVESNNRKSGCPRHTPESIDRRRMWRDAPWRAREIECAEVSTRLTTETCPVLFISGGNCQKYLQDLFLREDSLFPLLGKGRGDHLMASHPSGSGSGNQES